MENDDLTMEDGEIQDGFLGEEEMENRRTLAAAHGEGAGMSWVEAVLLGTRQVSAVHRQPKSVAGKDEDEEGGDDDHDDEALHGAEREPPPPGTAADRPPPSAAVIARREAALVHRVTTLLGEEDDSEALLLLLAEAAADGVDIARWLGHGRSSIRGRTPLMEAAMQGRTACCAALAEAAGARGRGLNARNERGKYSALHYACYHGAGGAALELLVRGADPRLRNREGETALQSALANGRIECADLVRDFLRRPTFEPEASQTGTDRESTRRGVERAGQGGEEGVPKIGGRTEGVAAVAPEVCRANAVFCLGRRRRRVGDRVQPGRGLGVGVGTAAAEVGLGARRCARLHATNPCSGTPMEAFVLWSIANGRNPFQGERGERKEETPEEADSVDGGSDRGDGDAGEGRRAADVWLDYYIRVYNASLSRWWMNQQTSSTIDQREVLDTTQAVSGDPSPELAAAAKVRADATRPQARAAGGVWQPQEGSTYSLVVKKSKALVEGRRFELRPGSNVVVGRSQHANIVVKDEMVSKIHLRIINTADSGVRMSDLGSKHGAVITKPAPAATPTDNPPAEATHHDHTGDTRPSGLGGKDPPSVTRANAASPADASRSPVQQPPPSSKQKFFPVPIPREPEWVAGAHGDQISLGKTVMLLEREGGPEPPNGGRYRPAGAAAEEGAGVAGEVRPVPVKQPPRVISKGFAVNPNLNDAIRTAEEADRERKRLALASEVAAAAAAEYLSNKRARLATAAAPVRAPPARLPIAPGPWASTNMGAPGAAAAAAAAGTIAASNADEPRDSFEHVAKGSMLLKRMGWKEGQGLGRRSDGQLRPLQVQRRGEREGLGTAQSSGNPFAVGSDGRISKWEQMRRRFAESQASGSGFASSGPRRDSVRWLAGKAEGGSG